MCSVERMDTLTPLTAECELEQLWTKKALRPADNKM